MIKEFNANENYKPGEMVRTSKDDGNITDFLIYSIHPIMMTLIDATVTLHITGHEELGRSIYAVICETSGNPPDKILVHGFSMRVYENLSKTREEFREYLSFIQQHQGGNY